MKSKMVEFIPFNLLILLILGGCVSSDWMSSGKLKKSELLNTNSFHEECATLSPDQYLDYSFEATKPVHFNIHYHEGEDVRYPVSEENISTLKAAFVPESKQNYCLMWSNKQPEPVQLKYELHLRTEEE
jgi:hypothetical protein